MSVFVILRTMLLIYLKLYICKSSLYLFLRIEDKHFSLVICRIYFHGQNNFHFVNHYSPLMLKYFTEYITWNIQFTSWIHIHNSNMFL